MNFLFILVFRGPLQAHVVNNREVCCLNRLYACDCKYCISIDMDICSAAHLCFELYAYRINHMGLSPDVM